MNLGGKAQSPQISFDFDLPNVNEDEKQMVRSLISTEEEKKHAGDLPPRHRAFLHLRLQQHGTKPILRGHEVIVVLYSERATQPNVFPRCSATTATGTSGTNLSARAKRDGATWT